MFDYDRKGRQGERVGQNMGGGLIYGMTTMIRLELLMRIQ